MNMTRTRISLDAKDYEQVKAEARVLGITVAEFIRRAIRHRLGWTIEAPWMKYAGFVKSGNPRSSQSVDELY
jgi:hypothetical protein